MSYVNTGTLNNFIATTKTRTKIKSRKTYLIFLSHGVWMDGGIFLCLRRNVTLQQYS